MMVVVVCGGRGSHTFLLEGDVLTHKKIYDRVREKNQGTLIPPTFCYIWAEKNGGNFKKCPRVNLY